MNKDKYHFSHYCPDLKGMFILMALLFAGSLVGSFVSAALGMACGQDFVTKYSMLVTYPLQFVPALWYAAAKSRKNAQTQPCIRLDEGRFAPVGAFQLGIMVVAGTLACSIVTEPVVALLPQMPEMLKRAMAILTDGPLWVAIASTCIMAPVLEEWLCRGMVLRGMMQKYSPAAAILISAAFFAFIHLNPWQAIPAFVLGCLFGLVYVKTGSLKLTMLMHCANNAMSLATSRLVGKEIEYTWQIIGDMKQYYLLYASSVFIVLWLLLRMKKIKFN